MRQSLIDSKSFNLLHPMIHFGQPSTSVTVPGLKKVKNKKPEKTNSKTKMAEIKPLRLKRKKSTDSKNILYDTEDCIEPSMEELLKIQANGATNSDDESRVESSHRQKNVIATKRTKKDRCF